MSNFQTPGVYVLEIPPTAVPITGVGTSTAAILGIGNVDPSAMPETPQSPKLFSEGTITYAKATRTATLSGATFPEIPSDATLMINNQTYSVASRNASGSSLVLTPDKVPGADISTPTPYQLAIAIRYQQADAGNPVLVTSWTEFKQSFGDFNSGNKFLAQSVYGFFNNGGTRCYVVRMADANGIDAALAKVATIDEVALVAAPLGLGADDTSATLLNAVQGKLLDHCTLLGDRFAILDSTEKIKGNLVPSTDNTGIWVPGNDDGYGAFYFPWIKVDDPLSLNGDSVLVPPSGHVAGMYARVDANRGVYKAPANEQLLGVRGLAYDLTKNQQAGLNIRGINCLRSFYGTPLVWGARTVSSNSVFRYVNVRRFMNFLRESIEQGVRWAVFEPNSPALWQRISRSVGDFLLGQWRDGALFGAKPRDAFYVICDATTNPSDVREQGQVVTEIGVAVVKPAEFVVFRVQQQTGG